MIVQIDADLAMEKFSGWSEPDRVQIALRQYTWRDTKRGGPRGRGICQRRWLLTVTGAVYYVDDPDEMW